MVFFNKNQNKSNLEVRNEEIQSRSKKKSNNWKLLSNTPKKINKDFKPSDEFDGESEVNYCEDKEVRKRKLKCSKKKPCNRKQFLKEDKILHEVRG